MPGVADGHEDTHFYIDNAPPRELLAVLRVMSPAVTISPKNAQATIWREYGTDAMQKDATYASRRLFDIGALSNQPSMYQLTERGIALQQLLSVNEAFVIDLMHYLQFTRFGFEGCSRKLLWTYRRVCEHFWSHGELTNYKELAAILQDEMRERFKKAIDFEKTQHMGARIDSTGVGRVTTWLRSLTPSPFVEKGTEIIPRVVDREELALLALDDVYRWEQYAYGDAVILDDRLLRRLAGVFFLDTECCRTLLRRAARRDILRMSDTLAGPAVTLLRPFTVEQCI